MSVILSAFDCSFQGPKDGGCNHENILFLHKRQCEPNVRSESTKLFSAYEHVSEGNLTWYLITMNNI